MEQYLGQDLLSEINQVIIDDRTYLARRLETAPGWPHREGPVLRSFLGNRERK